MVGNIFLPGPYEDFFLLRAFLDMAGGASFTLLYIRVRA